MHHRFFATERTGDQDGTDTHLIIISLYVETLSIELLKT